LRSVVSRGCSWGECSVRHRQPIFVTAPPGDPRLFVVEKVGRIRIVADGDVQPEPFLDVRDKVRAGGPTAEQGMFVGRSGGCPSQGFVDPDVQYSHEDTCAVVGGFVHRGTALPELAGRYFYTDVCGGGLHSLRYNAKGKVVEKRDWTEQVGQIPLPTSFGLDAGGEVYITSAEDAVYRLAAGDDWRRHGVPPWHHDPS
jgi:hypothetical protein